MTQLFVCVGGGGGVLVCVPHAKIFKTSIFAFLIFFQIKDEITPSSYNSQKKLI